MIETKRLVLEPLTATHADLLFEPLQDRRIYHWISVVPPARIEELRTRWGSLARSGDQGPLSLGWAVKRRADGLYVGKCDAEVTAGIATNVGYLIFPGCWNQGYATELLHALVATLAQHSVTELHAFVTAGNRASERVLLKGGFHKARLIPDADTIRGVRHDDVEYVSFGAKT